MDPEPGSDLLIPRGLPYVLGLAGTLAAACAGEPPAPPALPALAATATVLRLPSAGGTVIGYLPDSLKPAGWESAPGIPPVARPLGFDLDQRLVYFLDTRQRLVGLDLEAGVSRVYLTGVRLAQVGPDGAAYAVDSAERLSRVARRAVTPFHPLETAPAALFGAQNGQVVTLIRREASALRLESAEQAGVPIPVGDGPVTATHWGEVVAVARGDEVQLVRPSAPDRSRRVDVPREVAAMAFSPSGHRLYILDASGGVHAVDRFSGSRLGSLTLPGPGDLLRPDPSGRWMLVRPTGGDSVYVVDVATTSLAAVLRSDWGVTLPLVAGASTLLTAEGPNVVGWDLSGSPPRPTVQVPGGAADTWMAVPWVPAHRGREVVAASESAWVAQDAALIASVGDPRGAPSPSVWIQVSSSQNPEWARSLVRQLEAAGVRAEVWPPEGAEEGYRVVVGPYASRDEAEEAGRRMGRPYFVVSRPGPARRP